MVYDLHNIFRRVNRQLEITPSISSTQLAKNLGIERHTIAKAISGVAIPDNHIRKLHFEVRFGK